MVSRIKVLLSTTALVSVIGVASANAASTSINGPVTVNQVLTSGDSLTVTNSGSINVTTDAAVIVDGVTANSINNSGTITSTDFDAVKLTNSGTLRRDLNNIGTIQGNFVGINVS